MISAGPVGFGEERVESVPSGTLEDGDGEFAGLLRCGFVGIVAVPVEIDGGPASN